MAIENDGIHILKDDSALNKLCDRDGVFNIRRYFKDVLWPEKKQSR